MKEYLERFVAEADGDYLEAAYNWACSQLEEDGVYHDTMKLAARAALYFGLSIEDEFELGERLGGNDSGSLVTADLGPDRGSPGDGLDEPHNFKFETVKAKVLA